jgi:hypothetical protein
MGMAKKSKARMQTLSPRQQSPQKPRTARRWRLKLVIGGAVLAVALGVGGLVRFLQQRDLAPGLQGPENKHYTLGTAGAPVVIKEFSDYT